MSFELLYTSAPAGLKPGTRGFTTVQCTDGIPSNVALRLETLSGYRHLFPPSDRRASENPVCYSHLRVPIAGKPTSVISRVGDYGVDYSGRTNKVAHHVVLEPIELNEAGPGWLIRQKSFLRDSWDGTTRLLPAGPAIPSGSSPLRICQSWKAITGDAGWGGFLADAIEGFRGKPVWIVFRIDQSSSLPLLIEEALALLPPQDRWQSTFTTYYTNLPPEVECRVRCVLVGSEEAKLAPTRGIVIDISRPLPVLASTPRVEAARTGFAAISIPPVQRSPLTSETGRVLSKPLVEDDEGESLWPDEIRLAPPTVSKSQVGPPAIKNAKGSGPPKVKLPPDLVGQPLLKGRFSTRSVRLASILFIATSSILSYVAFSNYVILKQLKRKSSISEFSATNANSIQTGEHSSGPISLGIDSESAVGASGKNGPRELIFNKPMIALAKEDILKAVSDAEIVIDEVLSIGSKLLMQSRAKVISLAIAYSEHRAKALRVVEIDRKDSNITGSKVADKSVAQDEKPIQASTRIFKSLRDKSLLVEFELPAVFTNAPTNYQFQAVTEKDQPANDTKINFGDEYDTKQGLKLTLTHENNKIVGVATIDKDFLRLIANTELDALYLLRSELISMHASYDDYKHKWNSLIKRFEGARDLLANVKPLPVIDLQSLYKDPDKSLNQLEKSLLEIAAFQLMLERQPNARKTQADYKDLVDALPKNLSWNIKDVRDRCKKLNEIEMIPEFTIGSLQLYTVLDGQLIRKNIPPSYQVTLRLKTAVK
jgi:hypothetical protein